MRTNNKRRRPAAARPVAEPFVKPSPQTASCAKPATDDAAGEPVAPARTSVDERSKGPHPSTVHTNIINNNTNNVRVATLPSPLSSSLSSAAMPSRCATAPSVPGSQRRKAPNGTIAAGSEIADPTCDPCLSTLGFPRPSSSSTSTSSLAAGRGENRPLPGWIDTLQRFMPRVVVFAALLAVNLYRALGDLVMARRRETERLERCLASASTYAEYCERAEALDAHLGLERWKAERESELYDHRLIAKRLAVLRARRAAGDVDGVLFLLRSGLLRNLGGIGNKDLFRHTHAGTKRLIEEYVEEVASALEEIARGPPPPGMTGPERLQFFRDTRHAFGRTALLLSGGAAFGMYHIGVIKALFEAHLLPRVISGSSVGALVAGMLAVTPDEELPNIFRPGSINLDVFERIGEGSALRRRLQRVLVEGTLMDVGKLEDWARANMGQVTFEEAYKRTGRIVSITVSSTKSLQFPRLLNYLTAPRVLVWSAAAASCAIPGVYAAVELMAKDAKGGIVPYHPSEVKWSDGSVQNDLPMARLSEMFNVNHFVVSQVNPHVVMFMARDDEEAGLPRRALRAAIKLATDEIQHRLRQMVEFGLVPRFARLLQPIFAQRYTGDITITPDITLDEYRGLLRNPSVDELTRCVGKGERATWPFLCMISTHCRIELVLDAAVVRLKGEARETQTRDCLRAGAEAAREEDRVRGGGALAKK